MIRSSSSLNLIIAVVPRLHCCLLRPTSESIPAGSASFHNQTIVASALPLAPLRRHVTSNFNTDAGEVQNIFTFPFLKFLGM